MTLLVSHREATRPSWDRWYIELAAFVAGRSRDPSTKVGAVIVRPDKTIASVGFNGFPRGVSDDPALYANREEKYKRVVHAEMNAILTAREPLHGYTMYLSLMPCERCAVHVIQAGIKSVVAQAPSPEQSERWADAMATAIALFEEAGVEFMQL